VPADAAFYSANLRLKEQWDVFAASRAFARLMEIPFIQSMKMYAEFQLEQSPEPDLVKLREYLDSNEGKETLALVKEMVSDEIFLYGSADVAELFVLFAEFNNITRTVQFEAAVSGQSEDEIIARKVFDWLESKKSQLKLPDVVLGFRIRNRERATRLLGLFERDVKALLAEPAPEIAARMRREQIAGREFVTLRLDGSMLPWEQIRGDATDVTDEQFAKWKALVVDKTVAVAVGIVDEFLVVSFGDSTDHLARLGQGPLLAEQASIARLNRHAKERLAGVSFGSQEFVTKASSPQRSMNDAAAMVSDMLKLAPIGQDLQKRLSDDIRGFADAVVKYLPQPGEMAAVGFLTPRGYQGFAYGKGTRPGADSSKRLEILSHVGGNPMLFIATHAGDTVEDYNLAIDWLKRLALDVEKIVEQQAPPDEWAKHLQFRERGIQLLRRIDRANREQIIPAMRSNEQALVMDVASKSIQWFAPMPRARQPLPMLEIGIVARVDDAALLRRGVAEYASVIEDALKLAHDVQPDQIPPLQLPAPTERLLADGSLYSYPFPAEWGVDSQLALNGALTNRVVAVSLLPAFTEQLLNPTPPAIDSAIDLTRPATQATHFQFAKLIGAIRPWVDYGFAAATGQLPTDDSLPGEDPAQQAVLLQAGFILPQVNQLLDVLSTIRSHTSITYREDDAWVTHSELYVKDLD
jgi:hypothetical protein